MLKRVLIGLTILQFTATTVPVWAAGGSGADSIRTMRANALQHLAQGQSDIGLKIFENAIEQAERTFGKGSTFVADLCFDAGIAAFKTDQYQKAEHCLTKAVQVNPHATEARLQLANFYQYKGRFNDARSQLVKVLHADPNNLEAHELLALTYQKEGNTAKANHEYYQLEEIATGHSVATPQTALAMAVHPPAPPNPLNVRAAQAPKPVGEAKPAVETPKPADDQAAKQSPKVDPLKEKIEKADKEAKAKLALLQKLKQEAEKQKKDKRAKKEQKRSKKNAAPQDIESVGGLLGVKERINAKAVLLTKVKNAQNATAETVETSSPPPVETPAPKPRPVKPVKVPRGFVPPPPAMPLYPAAPPQAVPPAPKPLAPALKPAKPMEDPGVEKPAPARDPDAHKPSAPVDEDDDFLLDWAGKKKKKGR